MKRLNNYTIAYFKDYCGDLFLSFTLKDNTKKYYLQYVGLVDVNVNFRKSED